MTDCNWTEKVSLLIDGELAATDARAVEQHLGDCFACRLAREDFLLLRHQLSSYHADVNLLAQRRALASILGSDNSARPAVNASNRRERAQGLFALPRFSPALAAASALVLVCLVVGFLMLRDKTPNQVVPEEAKIKPKGPGGINLAQSGGIDAPKSRTTDMPTGKLAKGGVKPKGTNSTNNDKARQSKPAEAMQTASAAGESDDLPLIIPPRIPTADSGAADGAEMAALVPEPRPEADPTGLSPARHAEQAQQLLRSFRNAERGGADNLAYERERSQALLYQNIVLRREAASSGNVAVESVLGSLEPILVDIANLSDKPAREDVRSINERMKKKDIVAQLQIAARD